MFKRLREKSQQFIASSGPSERPSLAHRDRSKSAAAVETHHGEEEAEREVGRQTFGSLSVPQDPIVRPVSADGSRFSSNPLGLTLVHTPSGIASADIVFIHGLGGTSRQTWSWNRDVDHFWPGNWLPQEPDVSSARIFTFGYDADFRSSKSGFLSGINDFAKDLLFSLKFGKTTTSADLKLGEKPIIFVVHSLGGLILKKACIFGQNDDHYRDIISSIDAILFLSTPHRGSNLAESLNRVLSVSLTYSPKRFISEITENSTTLEDLNEQFRNTAPNMQIFCFYETLQTSTGFVKHMIVEKDSSILGYPGEISKPLRADHHNVCKYESRDDENYVSVRNTLQTLVVGYQEAYTKFTLQQTEEDIREIETQLGLTTHQLAEEDHSFFSSRRAPGTSTWILEDKAFADWQQKIPRSAVAWLQLPPARGKSILMSYIIDHLREQGCMTQYFYVRFGDQIKRSIAAVLKNIALQLAQELPAFRQFLKALLRSRPGLGNIEARAFWQIVFVSQLFGMEQKQPVYWIIDGLDESDSPQSFLELLSHLRLSKIPIRALISSRPSSQLSHSFSRLSKSIQVNTISFSTVSTDMRIFARQELDQVPWNEELKNQVVDRILQKAEGNFLWVNLVLQEIVICHTPEAIEEVLDGIPPDMENLYQSMEATLLKNLRRGDIPMSRKILSWAALSRYPLHVDQIAQALSPEFSTLLDPRHAVAHVCGQFAMIDANGRVVMLHQTARDYLLKASSSEIALKAVICHTQHATRCLEAVLSPIEAYPKSLQDDNNFLAYASTAWFFHLKSSDASDDALFDTLVKFLSTRSVLDWIFHLASCKQLRPVIRASRVLAKFGNKRKRQDAEKSPLLHRLTDLDLIENWSVDFVRIVGKFGSTLRDEPDAIYKLIPPLCPKGSIIYRQFVDQNNSRGAISLSGIHNAEWDDNVARILVSPRARALLIQCSTAYLAVACSNRAIAIRDAISTEAVHELQHDEPLATMCFAPDGSLLATVGYRTTKLWNVESGQEILTVHNPHRVRAMTASFTPHGASLIAGFDDSSIRSIDDFQFDDASWRTITIMKAQNDFFIPGLIQNSPSAMAFSSDGSYVAVAMRGSPMSVWQISSSSSLIARCSRNRSGRSMSSQDWTSVDCVRWHPSTGDVLGIYMDGHVFKWHPFSDQHQEIYTSASDIECSPEGTVFITSDSDGNIHLYDFYAFALIYRLSGDDIISAMTISPDCRRFYDIRRNVCNIWEPSVLTRLHETEDSNSDSKSTVESLTLTLTASEGFAESNTPITAMEPLQNDSLVLVGDEEGAVKLHDYANDSSAEVWRSPNMMAIEHLSANEDGTLVVSADLGGTIALNKLSRKKKTPGSVHLVGLIEDNNDNSSVTQTLLHPSLNLLLVLRGQQSQLWSIPSADGEELICGKSTHTGHAVRFATNPVDYGQLLAFKGNEQVYVYLWKDLSTVCRLSLDVGSVVPSSPSTPTQAMNFDAQLLYSDVKILKLFADTTKSSLVLQTFVGGRQRSEKYRTSILPSSAFSAYSDDGAAEDVNTLPLLSIPPTILDSIEAPLAVLDGARLVYLDKQFWVCTWHMANSKSTPARRHFPIPRYWVEPEALKLCCIGSDAAFLYPVNGEIATVYSDIARGW